MNQTLNRSSSLKSRSVIKAIFENKKGFIQYPIRVSYIEQEASVPLKLVFSAPKRNFKKAVDRNRLKRMMREAYRTNQDLLTSSLVNEQKSLAVYIGYIGKEFFAYSIIEEKIKLSLIRLQQEIEK